MVKPIALLTLLITSVLPAAAQAPPSDPIDGLMRRFEMALQTGDRTGFPSLFADTVGAERIAQHESDFFVDDAARAAIVERARADLEGAPPGDGFRLVVELFIETSGTARILTAGVDVRRPTGGGPESWRIASIDSVSAIDGLYKLRLATGGASSVQNLEITSEDVTIAMTEGVIFPIDSDAGTTGLVLVGRGELRFSPAPASERGQLRIFAGTEALATPFETAYIRLNPGRYLQQVAGATLSPAPADERLTRRAQEVFRRHSPRTFTVDVADMSRDVWHLLPATDDLVAEVDTRRFDTLTYSRSGLQAEDVSLFRREDRKTIVLYASAAKLAARGRFYSDDTSREYDVLDYAVAADVDPQRQTIRGRARLSMRIRSTAVSTILVRLADSLAVSSVASVEHGRLLHLRLEGQNLIAVSFASPLYQDSDLTLFVDYRGRIESQDLDIDTAQPDAPPTALSDFETKYLLSNRSYWYPQNPIPDYATASMRLTVPNGFRAVASGEPVPLEALPPDTDAAAATDGRTFAFQANEPLRYLAAVVSRLNTVAERRIEFAPSSAGSPDPMLLSVETHPRQQRRGRELLEAAEEILRFYTSLVGDAPYSSATIALTESALPGGHSPGYFALLNEPRPPTQPIWRGDPVAFDNVPDFFLAHELAHQWWGQAVAWKNYHEQWLAEGFAQYFAAMYTHRTRGDRVFTDMLRRFRETALERSDQGPVYLGYRLGHIRGNLRVYRALVYNKGAAVLHMLRRLLGDETFFDGIRLYYQDRRYQKAGTEDLQRAMEAASGRSLERYFERWIYSAEIPVVWYTTRTDDSAVTVTFEQRGETIFDIPVTVRIVHADREESEIVVALTDRETVRTIPVDKPVREVQVNRDYAALAEFERQ